MRSCRKAPRRTGSAVTRPSPRRLISAARAGGKVRSFPNRMPTVLAIRSLVLVNLGMRPKPLRPYYTAPRGDSDASRGAWVDECGPGAPDGAALVRARGEADPRLPHVDGARPAERGPRAH